MIMADLEWGVKVESVRRHNGHAVPDEAMALLELLVLLEANDGSTKEGHVPVLRQYRSPKLRALARFSLWVVIT